MRIHSLTILLVAILVKEALQECLSITEKVSNLHGVNQLPSVLVPVTECNPNVVIKSDPIALDSYEDYLKIENNGRLQKVFANTFSLLPNLKSLIISRVQLENLEPNSFKGLSNLRYLNLQVNRLRTLPEHIFDDVPNLIELNLEYNRLEVIEQHLFDNLKDLKKLNLGNNQIWQLENQWSTGLQSLQYLSLAYNRLTTLKTLNFQSLSNLDTLRIQLNNITIIERDAFKGLANVQSLSIEGGGIVQNGDLKHELENLPKLKGLSLNPLSFQCSVLKKGLDYADEKYIDVVKIPDVNLC